MATAFDGDVIVQGNLYGKNIIPTASSVTDSSVAVNAGIQATKMRHRHCKKGSLAGVAVTETDPIHVVIGATANVIAFMAGCIVPPIGAATVTVDLRLNGASVLTVPITINSGSTARIIQAAIVLTTAGVVGGWYDVVVTATAGGGTLPSGVFWQFTVDEDPS
jgi:hypothetical protein